MQKRRKPEPIQLNPIPDGNTINGTGATEWVWLYESVDHCTANVVPHVETDVMKQTYLSYMILLAFQKVTNY